jgi:hypothetical protein
MEFRTSIDSFGPVSCLESCRRTSTSRRERRPRVRASGRFFHT